MQIRRLPLGMALAYSPRGPVVHPEELATAEILLDAAIADAREQGASLLKVDPLVVNNEEVFWADFLAKKGFRPSGLQIQPRLSVITDLTPNEEEILARFERTHRYNVRLAERRGVTVEPSDDFPTFYELLRQTSSREHFLIHSREYFQKMYESLAGEGLAQLLIAGQEGKPLAACMVYLCGRHAYYPYGASAYEGKEHKATQALQWASMRWAKEHGATNYDFWGLPVQEMGVLKGVAAFKKGFGGRIVQYQPAMDLTLRPTSAAMFRLAIWLEIRWRNLRTHGSLVSPLGES